MGFLPVLIGAIIVVVLGWILSGILAGLIEKGLIAKFVAGLVRATVSEMGFGNPDLIAP